MIRRSDNTTATQIRDIVGNAAITALGGARGHDALRRRPGLGPLADHRARPDAVLPATSSGSLPERHRAYALRLLRTIVPSQRWGMGRTIPEGWRLHFKGGWGSGSGAVDHQVGLLRRGDKRVAIAILTTGSPSHAYGKATLAGVSRRLMRGLGRVRTGTAGTPEAAIR